jgi:hypothetical protein
MTIKNDNSSQKPDCIVIDTNIWRSDLLLKTPVGVSLVYALGRQGGFIGLPEVVERELSQQVLEAGIKAVGNLREFSWTIDTLTGSSFAASLPTQIELENIVAARIAELDSILVRVPFTLEHAKAALDMVSAKLPPNGPKNQQFKDSAIWQAVLALSGEYTVHLITNDRGFLREPGNPSQGLALNLEEDCGRVGEKVGVYCDLRSCLGAISGYVPSFDKDYLASLIAESIMPRVRDEAVANRLEIRELLDTDIKAFRTGQPDWLAVDYTVKARCEFLDESLEEPDPRTDCRAITHGSCYYDVQEGSISGHFIEYITFDWEYGMGGHGRVSRSLGKEDPSIPFRRTVEF